MTTEMNKEYSVNWKNHMSHIRKSFDSLLASNELTDVTLHCGGQKMGAHKILLSACSAYFRDIFKEVPCHHPVVIIWGMDFMVLRDILHFIYNGEVSVDTARLEAFLQAARMLQISGLSGAEEVGTEVPQEEEPPEAEPAPRSPKRSHEETEGAQRPSPKAEGDTAFFISDVKCEPSELMNFEDPVEDPLLQGEGQADIKEFLRNSTSQNPGNEEFKQQRPVKNSWPLSTVKCNVCDKVFSHPYSLQQHKPVHAGTTRCPICKAVLSRKYHLKLHMKARHNLN